MWIGTLAIAYFLPANKPLLFMLLGCVIGIVLGGSQALSRSMFSQLIPSGQEAEYFGIYEISQDGTTWLGPLLFGLAYQLDGQLPDRDHVAVDILRGRVLRAGGGADATGDRGGRQRAAARWSDLRRAGAVQR